MAKTPDCTSTLQCGSCEATVAPDLTLIVAWTPSGLTSLSFSKASGISAENDIQIPPFVRETVRLLRAYFRGIPVEFKQLPLDLTLATAFQHAVWTACRRIPWAQTRPYAWIASEIGRPAAARPVGNALSRNPLPIVIPCHRVIRTDGSIGGFRYGPSLKRRLLRLESRKWAAYE